MDLSGNGIKRLLNTQSRNVSIYVFIIIILKPIRSHIWYTCALLTYTPVCNNNNYQVSVYKEIVDIFQFSGAKVELTRKYLLLFRCVLQNKVLMVVAMFKTNRLLWLKKCCCCNFLHWIICLESHRHHSWIRLTQLCLRTINMNKTGFISFFAKSLLLLEILNLNPNSQIQIWEALCFVQS